MDMRTVFVRLTMSAVIFMMSCGMFTPCAKNVLPGLQGRDDVQSVYVSPMLMRMTGASSYSDMGQGMISEVKSVHVYQCDSKESVELAMKVLEEYLEKHKEYEVMVSSSEDSEENIIYGRPSNKNPDECDSMIIVNKEDVDELNLVFLNAD